MTIKIYNTLGKKKEDFIPINPGKVSMYVCGPTVYDSSHIGHARSVVVFDVIARYFTAKGFDVNYIRNFTDVDDKIINKANELGTDCKTVSEKYIAEFHQDMGALNVDRASEEPRATEHIDGMIRFVQGLIEKGKAYAVDGDVYFAVESFDGYGKLSGRKLEDMEAGARVDINERKRNPFDFALWKAAKPEEPSWESPWGKGRPGWHIECSVMSSHFLGETFDIHGGGKDLIFPHHENEIAQSEGMHGKPFARYWVHNGFVNIDQEKMSKSLGNFLMIRDVIATYHPEAVRLFLLSSHYRSPIDFNDQALDESTTGLDKIYTTLERAEKVLKDIPAGGDGSGEYAARFMEAMDDDFNTAKGIGFLFDVSRHINRMLDEQKDAPDAATQEKIVTAVGDFRYMTNILGIVTYSPADYFEQKRARAAEKEAIDPVNIEDLIRQRTDARKSKDWARADAVRDQLDKMNVVLEDRPDGTIWKIKE